MLELIKKLCEASSAPSAELSVAEVIRGELKGLEVESDSLGNLIFSKGEGKPVLMLAAHMDEVGLMVKHVEESGFLRFVKLGGIADQALLGSRVEVWGKKGKVVGVVASRPFHLMKEEERKKLIRYERMFIDIGASSKAEVEELGVEIGSPITFKASVELMGKYIVGKAFDDRLGCAVLIEVLKRIKPECKVYGCFTTQEEVGLRGARVCSFKTSPTVGIAIDTTCAGDQPEVQAQEAPVKLGKGAVICVADGKKEGMVDGLLASPRVRQWLQVAAESANVPYQLEVFEGGTTDASVIALSKAGVAAGAIAIPVRYLHTACEVACLQDVNAAVNLLCTALQCLDLLQL